MSAQPIADGVPERDAREVRTSVVDFYRYWMPRLTGYLESQTADHRWVEDVARESMLAAEAKWDDLMTYDKPGTWLFRAATTMLRRWQAHAREQCTSLDDAIVRTAHTVLVAESCDSRMEGQLDLLSAIRMLPRRQREALALHLLLGFGLADVARITGVTEASARTHVQRARHRLEEVMRLPLATITGGARA